MAEELGKIEKPESGQFKEKRKLFLVPLLYSWEDAPPEYSERFELYWKQVDEHLKNLESQIGEVKRIYHESICVAGEEGLNILEKISPATCRLVKEKRESGAIIEATEDIELTDECLDWERHLLMGFVSQKVANKVSEFYIEAAKKRYEYIAAKINDTMEEPEAGLLFIREGHRVQFPADIEVFSVAPPALDEIHRWMRERQATNEKPEETEETGEDKKDESESSE
jgi:hypothetical protein